MGLLTVSQTCEELQISRATLFRLIKAGKVKVVRLGPRTLRIDQAEIDRIKKGGV